MTALNCASTAFPLPCPCVCTQAFWLSLWLSRCGVQSRCDGPGTDFTGKATEPPEPGETAEERDRCVMAARALQEECCGHQLGCRSRAQGRYCAGCPFHVQSPLCCCSAGDLPFWSSSSIVEGQCCCFVFTSGSQPVLKDAWEIAYWLGKIKSRA